MKPKRQKKTLKHKKPKRIAPGGRVRRKKTGKAAKAAAAPAKVKAGKRTRAPVQNQGHLAFNQGYDLGFTQGFAQGMQDGQSYLQ